MNHKEKYHLVTSSDLRTWSTSKRNLLIGPWCEVINLKNSKLAHYKYDVADHTENPFFKRKHDERHFFARLLSSFLSEQLHLILNKSNKTNFTEKYWKILTLPYIQIFSDVFSELFIKVSYLFENYNIESITFFKFDEEQQTIPFDYLDSYISLKCNDQTLSWIIQNIISYKKYKLNINYVNFNNFDYFVKGSINEITYDSLSLKSLIQNIIVKITQIIGNNQNDPLIIGSMLPFKEEFLLKIKLGLFPVFYSQPFPKKNHIKLHKRKVITNLNTKNNFNDLLIYLFIIFLPSCYLENFQDIKTSLKFLKWPKNPKYILTSNYIYTNELLKIYIAEKRELHKTPIYLMQHGHHYATRYMMTVEEEIADKFFVWGKKIYSQNSIPLYCSKHPRNSKPNHFIKKNKLLFIISTPERNKSALMGIDLNNFRANQHFLFKTIKSLDDSIKKNVVCRLRHANTSDFCNDQKFIEEFDPNLEIETGGMPIKKFIKKGRLIVHCYDSTGFLETIAMNTPSLLFFHEYEFNQFKDQEVFNDYKKLQKIGIIHTVPESLAKIINIKYSNLHEWWFSDKIQESIYNFKQKYTNTSIQPINTLIKKLNS